MHQLSGFTKWSLVWAGWYPFRSVNIQRLEEFLQQEDYEPNEVILEFLRRFDRLSIRFQDHFTNKWDRCHFNVKRAVASISREDIRNYERGLKTKLVPVGEIFQEYIMTMTPEGKMYAVYGDTVLCLGESGIDALNTICGDAKPMEVPFKRPEPEARPINTELSPLTRQRLREAGWSPGRWIDLAEIETFLRERGFSLVSVARDFLREFGLLRISYPSIHAPKNLYGCYFNPRPVLIDFPLEYFKEYARVLGSAMTPVGDLFFGLYLLFMAGDGKIYAALCETPTLVCLIGNSPIDALNTLCEPRPLEWFL